MFESFDYFHNMYIRDIFLTWFHNHQFFIFRSSFLSAKDQCLMAKNQFVAVFPLSFPFSVHPQFRCEIFVLFSCRSLKMREKCISCNLLDLFSLYIFWGKCVYFWMMKLKSEHTSLNTMTKTEMIYPKNVGASVAMNFT
jgi:hypothetical protein